MFSRRDFLKGLGIGALSLALGANPVEAFEQNKPTLEEQVMWSGVEFKSIEYKKVGNKIKNYTTILLDGKQKKFTDFYSFAWRLDKEWNISDKNQQRYIDDFVSTSLETRTKSKFTAGIKQIKARNMYRKLKKKNSDDLDCILQALRFQESGFNPKQGELVGCYTEFQFDEPTYNSTVKYVNSKSKKFNDKDKRAVDIGWEDLIKEGNSNVQEGFAKTILKVKKYRIMDSLGKDAIHKNSWPEFLFAAYNAGEGFVINSMKANFKGKKDVTWDEAASTLGSYLNIKKYGGLSGSWPRQKEWRIRRKMVILPEYVAACKKHMKNYKKEFVSHKRVSR